MLFIQIKNYLKSNINVKKICPLFIIFILSCAIVLASNPFSDEQISVPTTTNQGTSSTDSTNFTDATNTASTYTAEIKPGEKIIGTVDVETYLNIRTGPWGDIIGTFRGGDKCVITGKLGDWYQIEYDGRVAYVHSAYVLLPGETSKPFPRKGWINSLGGANVRRVPHGDIIGTINDQAFVEILGDAGDYYKIKWNNNEAFVSKMYVNAEVPDTSGSREENVHFTGVVTASVLNVRSAPWGPIISTLPMGSRVEVIGRQNDWYKISFNGSTAYVHSSWINRSEEQVAVSSNMDDTPPSEQKLRIGREARKLIGSQNFRGPEVAYGRLACAQVASTALKNAGVIDKVVLNVRSLVTMLKSEGWQEVNAPPFQEGDVITWMTYDYNGDGKKDPDTHVGIIIKEGNSYLAMNNCSLTRQPRLNEPYSIGPITRVLRKV